MTPVNTKKYNDANASGLITWTGQSIECLEICTGQNLNSVVYTIAEKVCELAAPLDLSTLTLQCALDLFNNEEEGSRTLSNVIQLLIDNECGLKELIDNLQAQVDGLSDDNFILDLKCLKEVDSYGNQLEYDLQSVCQQFVNEICSLKDNVTTLNGKVISLQNQINNLNIPSGDEVVVTTTISGPKVVSSALIDVSKDYTDYKTVIGTVAQIQTAISRQTSAFNSLMSSVTGWINTPTTEAQSINNMWLLLGNFLPRIAANEACCGSSCDDITIGFITDILNETAILRFTSGAGTFIPSGFTDCGSILTITNQLGVSTVVNVIVSQSGETDEIDLSMFTTGDVLDFNIDLKMCSETSTCQKCVNKTVKYIGEGCCIITATSDVTITYSITTNSTAI